MGLSSFRRARKDAEREQMDNLTNGQRLEPKTVGELKSALVDLGIDVPDGAKKADLQALYDETMQDGD